MKYKVISSILIKRTDKYYQSGLIVTDNEVNAKEAKYLIEKGVLEELVEKTPPVKKSTKK